MSRKKNKSSRSRPPTPLSLERWAHKAAAAQQRGAFAEAATYYTKVVTSDPNQASIWHALAGVQYQSGDHRSAIGSLRQAVAVEPNNVDYLNDLGGLLLAANELSSAEDVLRSVTVLQPTFAHGHYNLSDALYRQGNLSGALAELEKVIKLDPNYAPAYFNHGIALRDLGNMRGAVESFNKTVALQADNERAYFELARLFAALNFVSESISNYRRYVSLVPGDIQAVIEFAKTLHRNGETDEALQILERYIQTGPPNERMAICFGEILYNAGQLEKAEQTFVAALERFPEATQAAVGLSRLRRYRDHNDPVIQILRHSLEDASTLADSAPIHFALGKVFDDLGEFDTAFRHFKAGNEILSERVSYDKVKAEAEVGQLIEVFSPATITQYAALASGSEKPLLIVGMPRSGTTLVEQILASHKDTVGAGELAFFQTLAHQLPRIVGSAEQYPRCWEQLTQSVASEIITQYLTLLERHDGAAARVTDKMPSNYRHIGMLRCLFKNARIIVCRRDPRDVALSTYFQYFSERLDYAWSLSDIAHCYVQHERLVRHWLAILSDGIITIDYSDLVTSNESTTRRILNFAGLDWDPNCLKFHQIDRDVKTASNWQVRQPIYTFALDRWRNYESQLTDFTSQLRLERDRYGI